MAQLCLLAVETGLKLERLEKEICEDAGVAVSLENTRRLVHEMFVEQVRVIRRRAFTPPAVET